MTSIGDTHAALTRSESLARRVLALLDRSLVGAPRPTEDLGLWLQRTLPYASSLSTGERVLLDVGMAIWGGDDTARLRDLARLDDEMRHEVGVILGEWLA